MLLISARRTSWGHRWVDDFSGDCHRVPGRVQSLTSIMSNTGDRKSGMIDPKLALKLRRQGDPNPNDREAMIEQSVELWKWISGPTFDEAEAREFTAAGIDRALRVEGIERQTAAIFASRDRTAALRLVRTPTLVVHGLVDPLVRSSGGEATASDSRCTVVDVS